MADFTLTLYLGVSCDTVLNWAKAVLAVNNAMANSRTL